MLSKIILSALVVVLIVVGYNLLKGTQIDSSRILGSQRTESSPVSSNNASVSTNAVDDASLDASMSAINDKMVDVTNSSATVDQSFKDQPIPQTE